MADRSQPGQRNVFHPTAYKPDNRRDYHENYMQGLSFWSTDFPVHAQKSGAATVVKHSRPTMPHRRNVYGHHVDAGVTTDMQYDSLYPGALQGSHGKEVSFLRTRKDQMPRVRTPPGNRQGKIPSKFVVKPSSSPAAAAQIAAQAFGDTTRSFGPQLQRLEPADEHFVVPEKPSGSIVPRSTTYVPFRTTSQAPHLPTSPGTRRNLVPAKSDAEAMGNEYLRRGEHKSAVHCFSEALKNDPKNPTLYRNRAAAFAALGLWNDCVKDTEAVVSLMPNNRKAMLRHKAVVDYLANYNSTRGPGYDRQNLTIVHLLTPEEFTGNNYSSRLTFKPTLKPPKVRTLTDPLPPTFYENGAPTTEPLQWAKTRGSRYFWETQLTSPEARSKHRGNASRNPGDGWTVNPSPTTIQYS